MDNTDILACTNVELLRNPWLLLFMKGTPGSAWTCMLPRPGPAAAPAAVPALRTHGRPKETQRNAILLGMCSVCKRTRPSVVTASPVDRGSTQRLRIQNITLHLSVAIHQYRRGRTALASSRAQGNKTTSTSCCSSQRDVLKVRKLYRNHRKRRY